MPIAGRIGGRVYHLLTRSRFQTSRQYWENRYRAGWDSGTGSCNRLARFKADVINGLVEAHGVRTVCELGCGDGSQLSIATYPDYSGYDVSPTAVAACRERFAGDPSKRFETLAPGTRVEKAELTLSLDVIFHLVEDEVFESHMRQLFDAATRFVVIYSSNEDKPGSAAHVRHRKFTDWVDANRPDFTLMTYVGNKYPFRASDPYNTSFADFYIYSRKSS